MARPDSDATRPGRGAGAAALRARIEREGFAGQSGEAAYRAYMRSLRAKAPPDLPAIGGRACHQALRRDPAAYRERQRAGFQTACERHGRAAITGHIARAHAERRQWRLAHPTEAEAMLLHTLERLGYCLHPATADGAATVWPSETVFDAYDLIREARIGRYWVDVLLPARRIAIEAIGGVHTLQTHDDAQRVRDLEGSGLRVLVFANEQILAPDFAALLAAVL
jgi:hypothetical protein